VNGYEEKTMLTFQHKRERYLPPYLQKEINTKVRKYEKALFSSKSGIQFCSGSVNPDSFALLAAYSIDNYRTNLEHNAWEGIQAPAPPNQVYYNNYYGGGYI
jgi:hypothetical protein